MERYRTRTLISAAEGGMYGPGTVLPPSFDPAHPDNAVLISEGLVRPYSGPLPEDEPEAPQEPQEPQANVSGPDNASSPPEPPAEAQEGAQSADEGGSGSSGTIEEQTPPKPAARKSRAAKKENTA